MLAVAVRHALALLALAALCAAPTTLRASGCSEDIVVPIHFTADAQCWRHSGPGTTYTGQFAAHQHIRVRARGLYGPWQLSMTGPGGFSLEDNGTGQLDVTLPAAGKYSFTIGPCAEWGAPGNVEVCAQ